MIIPLTEKQKAIIVGNVLGDGGIYGYRYNQISGSSQFYIKQCEKYKDYVFWLFNEMKNICPSAPKFRNDYRQWYFYSKYLDNLTEIRKTFYVNKKKIVPKNIKEWLTSPLSLAVWYMDDGSLDFRPKDHYNFAFSTNAFSAEENYLLLDALKENFGISATVQTPLSRGKRYPEIYIGVAGRDKFLPLVKPYVLDCFSHKIPPFYSLTPQRLNP
ncbi:MAG: hypothetical protein A3G45_01015 [Candidatus Staskawiczbacteria bacterium RIFCSPLOWO2_12_FULL_37_15]|uniref:Homing endonuclease LAGLIDADG domain-containing protein n=1 Tax=Candidatus Staskawiczbacteria bacterium RIFCSPLOWO2_12_FULL_37_15 TaxID=1802218 RepID=A0A1G2IKL7_9BACT|nr:MAG: hypothetical protein A3G45_01015 [Candidatus Staskawiczbacteria bacterium RIFCSPLOWO2_12_FULL_37_15]